MLSAIRAVAACIALAGVTPVSLEAAEIKALIVPPLRTSMMELIPAFEAATGHKVTVKYEVSAVFKQRIEAGETFDVGIFTSTLTDELVKNGRITATSQVSLSRASIGLAIRKGSPKPDIGSVDAFKRTLQGARSIAYSPQGTSGIHTSALLERLGIASEIRPRLIAGPTGAIAAPVARGEAEMAILFISGIINEPGVELAGELPKELQFSDLYSAGIASDAAENSGSAALIRFLTSAAAGTIYRTKGLDPVKH